MLLVFYLRISAPTLIKPIEPAHSPSSVSFVLYGLLDPFSLPHPFANLKADLQAVVLEQDWN